MHKTAQLAKHCISSILIYYPPQPVVSVDLNPLLTHDIMLTWLTHNLAIAASTWGIQIQTKLSKATMNHVTPQNFHKPATTKNHWYSCYKNTKIIKPRI